MKKIISLLLVLAFALSALVGCKPHVHEFVYSEADSTPVTCLTAGVEVKVCSCGEKEETPIEATGHDMKVTMDVKPSCTRPGSIDYKCSKCGKVQYSNVEALGHVYEESSSEPSRVIRCTREGCISCLWGEDNGTHDEALTFSFTKEDEAAIDAKYDEVLALINAAPAYDATAHKYAETGELADQYAIVDKAHTELYDLVKHAIGQRQLAEIAYYCNMNNKEAEETYSYMMDYYTAVIAKFYTLSRPFYDSCYREFYYYGMTAEEINAFLFDSDTISNPEYTALKERNDAIEVEMLALGSDCFSGNALPMLYAEFVENNNKMAKLMGYENYLEYAYENVYGRDYTYQDAAQLAEYVKVHMSSVFNTVYNKYRGLSGFTAEDTEDYKSQTSYSFFTNLKGNTLVNDYIDKLAFTSNPNKNISFSDEFNKLMGDGNMFRGQYQGAFVTSIYSVNLPIAYFGAGYDSASTIVHEFGHFMNEIYSADVAEENDDFDQSYDLLEMHSQGNELLYLAFLKENGGITKMALNYVETYTLVNMLYIVMAGMTIDSFEQAIYLNTYAGTNADQIMADGVITYDEYDLLYAGICQDYGVSGIIDGYWRNGMTIKSACYYISYSVSAISVLQLYEIANTQGFDVAKDAYLKLFTYVDVDHDMTIEEILSYAGMHSYKDEALYVNLKNYITKK